MWRVGGQVLLVVVLSQFLCEFSVDQFNLHFSGHFWSLGEKIQN